MTRVWRTGIIFSGSRPITRLFASVLNALIIPVFVNPIRRYLPWWAQLQPAMHVDDVGEAVVQCIVDDSARGAQPVPQMQQLASRGKEE